LSANKARISLYFDEDVSVKIAINLRNRGFDVLHTVEASMIGSSDEEQLDKAILEQRTFLTHNKKHFRIMHDKCVVDGRKHFGIIVASRKRNPLETIRRILDIIQNVSPAEMENQIRFI
jgi:hypothetical protein